MPHGSPKHTRAIVRGAIIISALLVAAAIVIAVSPKPKTVLVDPDAFANEDSDGDGVINSLDACLDTAPGEAVDPLYGCSDNDLSPSVLTDIAPAPVLDIGAETGTSFTSEGVSISASQTVTMSLFVGSAQSAEFVVSASAAASVSFTLSGLTPNTTYFKHTQGHLNEVQLTSDASGSVTFTETISTEDLYVTLTTSSGTFTLPGDCSLIGVPIAGGCQLTTDVIDDHIVINASNFKLDCQDPSTFVNHTIGGSVSLPAPAAVTINNNLTDVTITNCIFDKTDVAAITAAGANTRLNINNSEFIRTSAAFGIPAVFVLLSDDVEIKDNSFHDIFEDALRLVRTDRADVSGNTVFDVPIFGFVIQGENDAVDNVFFDNTFNFSPDGSRPGNFPAILANNASRTKIDFNIINDAVDSQSITVNGGTGTVISKNTVSRTGLGDSAIFVGGSSAPIVELNTIIDPVGNAINFPGTANGVILNNIMTGVGDSCAIVHSGSSDTIVQGNTCDSLFGFVVFGGATGTKIVDNDITSGSDGILMFGDPNGTITDNTLIGLGGPGSTGIFGFNTTASIERNTTTGYPGGLGGIACISGSCQLSNNSIVNGLGPFVRGITFIATTGSS